MAITLGGVIIGALLARPYVFGISALIAITLLIVGWCFARDLRLAWLLLFGLVAGVMELLSDWLHVEY